MAYSSAEKEFYQRHYQGELKAADAGDFGGAERNHFAPGKRYHLLLSELDPQQRYGTAVEIGCSDGYCIAYLGSRFNFDKLVGLDIAFADGLQKRVGAVDFVQANSNERLPLEDGSVDVYVAMMVIEHLFDPFHAFREIERVLSPTGLGFINLPLVTSLKNRLRLLFGNLPVTSVAFDRWLIDKEWDGNHLHYFSMDSIRRLCAQSGLEVVKVAGVGSHHQLKSMLPNLLANEVSFVVRRLSTP